MPFGLAGQYLRLIDLLEFYCHKYDNARKYPLLDEVIPGFSQDLVNGGYYFPGSGQYKIKMVIHFYFIVKISEKENKVIFMNYKISEDRLYWHNITKYLYKDFVRFGLKTIKKAQIDASHKYVIKGGFWYEFSLGGKRK